MKLGDVGGVGGRGWPAGWAEGGAAGWARDQVVAVPPLPGRRLVPIKPRPRKPPIQTSGLNSALHQSNQWPLFCKRSFEAPLRHTAIHNFS